MRPGDPGDPFCRRPRRGLDVGLDEERERKRKKAGRERRKKAERERREAEEAAERARARAVEEAEGARRRDVEREAERTTPRGIELLLARARALAGPDSGFWLTLAETYYAPYSDEELEEVVRACEVERERRARPRIRYPGWGTGDDVEVLARHAINVSVVLSRRRERRGEPRSGA